MVLINKQYFEQPRAIAPGDHNPNVQGYYLKLTGEFFTSYADYAQAFDNYRTRHWNCKYNGKSNLTYKEATAMENKIKEQLQQFPGEYIERVCKATHHSIKTVDALTAELYADLKPSGDKAAAHDKVAGTPSQLKNKKSSGSIPNVNTTGKNAKEQDTKQKKPQAATTAATNKAPVSKALLKAFIIDNAEQVGPEGATLKVWVITPQLRQQFKLAQQIPDELKAKQEASISKKKKAKRETTDTATDATPAKKKAKTPTITSADVQGELPPVQHKTLEEVEKQYAAGTLKHALVQCLKDVQPQGLTVVQCIEAANRLKVMQIEEKQKPSVLRALTNDVNFVRLEKGVYSLHAFHPHVVVRKRKPSEGGKKKEEIATGANGDDDIGRSISGIDADVDPESALGKAKQLVKSSKQALSRCKAAVSRAQQAYDDAKEALEAAKKKKGGPSNKNSRPSDVHIPPELLAQFDFPESERDFKGEDRKGMMAHRQAVQAHVKELEKEKQKFIEKELKKRAEEAKKKAGMILKDVEAAYQKGATDLVTAKSKVAAAEKAVAQSEKKCADEERKAARDAEKARERAAKQDAKKYPIEDLDLLDSGVRAVFESTGLAEQHSLPDVKLPAPLPPEEASRFVNVLFVADILAQFHRNFGIKPLSISDIERLLNGEALSSGSSSTVTLATVYHKLVAVLLEDKHGGGDASPAEKRWLALLSEGSLPEILRRLVLSSYSANSAVGHPTSDNHNHSIRHQNEERAVLAANMLLFDSIDALNYNQHLALLTVLVEDVLCTEKMRTVLQKRLDDGQTTSKGLREEIAEGRKKLREIADSKKEQLKKQKEEEDAAADTADNVVAESDKKETAGMDSFDLPDDLKEYKGNPKDEAARLAFTKKQQAERRRLEKERNRHLADMLRKQREVEAQERVLKQVEEDREKEKERVEDALARAIEVLEEQQDRYLTRRQPVGCDRYHRRYWYPVGGDPSQIYIEDNQGQTWTLVTTTEELNALMESLDVRGNRELALRQTLEKKYASISTAMARVAAKASVGQRDEDKGEGSSKASSEKQRPQPVRSSSREIKQPEFYKPETAPTRTNRRGTAAKVVVPKSSASSLVTTLSVDLSSCLGPVEHKAAEELLVVLLSLQDSAKLLDVAPPEGFAHWAAWVKEVTNLATSTEGTTPQSLVAAFKSKLTSLEEVLSAAGDPPLVQDGGSSDDDDGRMGMNITGSHAMDTEGGGLSRIASTASMEVKEVVDAAFSPTKLPLLREKRLWKYGRERSAWQADIHQAATLSRVCFCAGVLNLQAKPLLKALTEELGPPQRGGKGDGLKRGRPPLPGNAKKAKVK